MPDAVAVGSEEHARRVGNTLNRFVGALHAARGTALIWIHNAGDPRYAIAAKYGLQMTFETTVLTLRKFQDLYRGNHLQVLIPEGTPTRARCEWILEQCREHNIRRSANLLFAHYAEDVDDPPLSSRETLALVQGGGWDTEEEVVEWTGTVIERMREIRDDVMRRYGIVRLAEDEEAV
jgi:hypothetical protein